MSVFSTGVATNETERESQLTRQRRSVIRQYDTKKCYKRFFIGGLPPDLPSDPDVRFICQVYGTTRCFSTMFHVKYGIPLYAGYVVKQGQASSFGTAPRAGLKFRSEPGEIADYVTQILRHVDISKNKFLQSNL